MAPETTAELCSLGICAFEQRFEYLGILKVMNFAEDAGEESGYIPIVQDLSIPFRSIGMPQSD